EIVAQQAAVAAQPPLQAAVGGGYAAPRMTPGFSPVVPQPAVAMRVDTSALSRASMMEARESPGLARGPAPRVEPRQPPQANEPAPAPEPPAPEPVRAEPPQAESPWAEAPAAEPPAAEPAGKPVAEKRRGPGIFSRAATKALDLARQTSADLRDATPSAMMTRIAKPDPVMRAPAPQPA